jgi:hypothetical protein
MRFLVDTQLRPPLPTGSPLKGMRRRMFERSNPLPPQKERKAGLLRRLPSSQ